MDMLMVDVSALPDVTAKPKPIEAVHGEPCDTVGDGAPPGAGGAGARGGGGDGMGSGSPGSVAGGDACARTGVGELMATITTRASAADARTMALVDRGTTRRM